MDKNLREALGNLFKRLGEMIETQKKPIPNTKCANEDKLVKLGKIGCCDKKQKNINPEVKVKIKCEKTIDKCCEKKSGLNTPNKKYCQVINLNPKKCETKNSKYANNNGCNQKVRQFTKSNCAQKCSNKNKIIQSAFTPWAGKPVVPKRQPTTGSNIKCCFMKKCSLNHEKKHKTTPPEQNNFIFFIEAKLLEDKKPPPPVQERKSKFCKENKDNVASQNAAFKNQNRHCHFKTSNDGLKPYSSFKGFKTLTEAYPNDVTDDSSNASFTDDFGNDCNSRYEVHITPMDNYEEENSFECDNLDDTYGDQLESDSSFSESDSFNSIHDPDYKSSNTVIEFSC